MMEFILVPVEKKENIRKQVRSGYALQWNNKKRKYDKRKITTVESSPIRGKGK